VPVPKTITQSATITSSVEIDQTATENDTATQIVTNTAEVTITQPTTSTVTATETVTAQPAPTSGACGALQNPYTGPDGHVYQITCDSFYPIGIIQIVATGTYTQFSDCVNACGANSACVGMDYNPGSGLCDQFDGNHQGVMSGYNAAIKIS
jgi:hypothetical protein